MRPAAHPFSSVFVTVGTDHHPFDRLVRWVDAWLEDRDDSVSCFVQRGTSAAPRRAESAEFLPYEEMEARMRAARAVVSHGGPATIMLARYNGAKPIVVPRRSELGEHVDDHQAIFSRRIAAEGSVELAESEADFRTLLDRAVDDQLVVESSTSHASVGMAVSRFEHLVNALLGVDPATAAARGTA